MESRLILYAHFLRSTVVADNSCCRTVQSAMFSWNKSCSFTRTMIGKRFSTSSPSSLFVTKTVGGAEGNQPRAVVLVLGFGGATPKHVAKYAGLYNDKGCSTVSGTASNHAVFVDHRGLDVFSKDAVHQVAKLLRGNDSRYPPISSSTKETPIVMHIISNGGAFTSRVIGNMLDSRDQKQQDTTCDLSLFANRLKLGCQVFDSAPCHLEMNSSFNVIKHLIPNPFIGIPAAMLFALWTQIVPRTVSMISGKPTAGELFWNDLLEDTNCNRQAIIYTDKDDVANAEKIDAFIRERRKRGVSVMAKHFEDSRHVQHIRLHEKEYSDFIEAVLTDLEESNESALCA